MNAVLRQPRPWLACLLGALVPGLGHVYAGRLREAALVFATLTVALGLVMFGMARGGAVLMFAPLLLALLVLTVSPIHAYRVARTPSARFVSRWALVGACAAFVLGTSLAGEAFDSIAWRFVGEAFRVPSGDMTPTLLIGDHFFADTGIDRRSDLRRGDIVVFRVARPGPGEAGPVDRHPGALVETFVKRIVGLPGDSIDFEGATLTVNGERATGAPMGDRFATLEGDALPVREEALDGRTYRILDDPRRETPKVSVRVEADRLFVAGDNRGNSSDSRYWGTIHRDDVVGRLSVLYWSWDFAGSFADLLDPRRSADVLDSQIRWERIGLRP